MIVKNLTKNFYINLSIIFLIFIIDRISKIYVINFNVKNSSTELYTSKFLNINLIWNEGIAFGLFSFSQNNLYNLLTAIILIGKDLSFLKTVSCSLKDRLSNFNDFTLLGPIPAPIEYINNEYRYRMLIKTNRAFRAQKVLKRINLNKILKNKVKIKIDIDPLSFF